MAISEKPPKTPEFCEESPEIYKLLVSNVRDYAIFLLDREGYICTWNAGAERAKQYTKDEIVGQHFSIFYTPEDKADGLPDRLLSLALDEGRAEDEGWRVRKDGSRFWADVLLTAIYDETGTHRGFAKVTRDLTQHRHLMREREEAQQANTAKSAFLANMSHELRTPLTAIIGYAEMLEEELQEIDPETLRDHLRKIMYSGRHLLSIISDILDLSKIEAGRLELQVAPFDISEVLQEVSETLKPLAACNNTVITVDAPTELPAITTDRTRLRQILYNLLSNAVKFTRDGQITATARTETINEVSFLRIDIKDTGVGMAPQDAAQIFDRFRQVAAHVRSYNSGGTGLGLAICRMLTEAMGGAISVISAPGEGSTFTVKLPVSR